MKKILITLCFYILFLINALPQTFLWAKGEGGIMDDRGNAICTDDLGNVYSTGFFSGIVDFNPGTGTYYLSSLGVIDIFVTKLDSSGNFIWARSFGGINGDDATGITLDGHGNVIITGIFSDTADFDPGPGIYNLASNGADDIFVSKLDPMGNFIAAIGIGDTSTDQSWSITTDAFNNIYFTGYFAGTVDFDPGPGIFNLNPTGAFVCKLDSVLNLTWAKRTGGGQSIKTDTHGNVYAAGAFGSTYDFDPGPGIYNLTAGGITDISIVKLDSVGNLVWAKQMGGGMGDQALSMDIDLQGNVYSTGFFIGTADFDPGVGVYNLTSFGIPYEADIFISKLSGSGNFLWAKRIGVGSDDMGFGLDVDDSNNVYTTGYFKANVDFDPGVGTFYLMSGLPSCDAFISKLDSLGNFIWAKKLGGNGDDCGNGIICDHVGNIYTTGYFMSNPGDFDPGPGIYNLSSSGWRDIFVHKLGNCPTLSPTSGIIGDTTICPSSSNIYSIASMLGATSYTWTLPVGWSGNSTTDSITAIAGANSGVISVVANNFCGSSMVQNLSVVVSPLNTSVSQSGAIFTSSSTSGLYQWIDCLGNTSISGETNQIYIASANGSYGVIISNNGCIDTSSCYNITNIGIPENSASYINIYPNPSTGKFTVDLIGNDVSGISIYNVLGEIIYNAVGSSVQVDISTQPEGVYFVKVVLGSAIFLKKIILSHRY